MSTGADSRGSGLLERLQRGVALEALGESGSSLGTEFVERETASMGEGAGAEESVPMGADTKANTRAHLRLMIFVSLRMAASAVAPSAPMLLNLRLRARWWGQ